MPEKSVREMNEKERRCNSLQAKVFNATLLNCFIIGLGFYTFALSRQLITQAYSIASSAHMSVTHAADPIPLAEDVLKTYKGLDYKDRGKVFTDEYRQIFEQYTHNESYIMLEKMLKFLLEQRHIRSVYRDV